MRRGVFALLSAFAALIVASGPALGQLTQISIVGPNAISVAPGTHAAAPFSVFISIDGRPAAGAHAIFSTLGSCGAFEGVTLLDVVADANGVATSPVMTAGPVPTSCQVNVGASGTSGTSYAVYVYDPATLRVVTTPGSVALTPGRDWLASATLVDAAQRPVIDATMRFTSPAPSCGTFGSSLVATTRTNAQGVATLAGFKAGSAPLACAILAQWVEGGTSASFVIEIFAPASATVTTAADTVQGYVNETTWIMLQLRSPGGIPITNTALTFDMATGPVGAAASLDRVEDTTDAHGIANVAALGNGITGDYGITLGFLGTTRSITVNQVLRGTPAPTTPGGKYQDMWWGGPAQNGWGLSVIQHGDKLFSVFYYYGGGGVPTWTVFPSGNWDATHVYYSGAMYLTQATPYFAYDATHLVLRGNGFMTLAFLNPDNAVVMLDMPFLGKQQWNVTRQKFGPVAKAMADHSDMWWGGPAQNGWGIAVLQQNQSLFIVWFTYGDNGQAAWYVAPAGAWTAPETWEAPLYRTTGTSGMLSFIHYDPADLKVFPVGNIRIRFAGDSATFDYSVDNRIGTIPLKRQSF